MNTLRVSSPLSADLEDLIRRTIAALLDVHSALGCGLSEGVYAAATRLELEARGIPFECEKLLPVRYRGRVIAHHRVDLVIDGRLIVELKSVESIHPVHVAQVVTYMRLTGVRAGLLVNFNVRLLKFGIRRVVL
jgi:GxxExxY protein